MKVVILPDTEQAFLYKLIGGWKELTNESLNDKPNIEMLRKEIKFKGSVVILSCYKQIMPQLLHSFLFLK